MKADMQMRDMDTQFGSLVLCEQDGAIVPLSWGVSGRNDPSEVLDTAVALLGAYDAGRRAVFDLPLHVRGGEVQRDVCAAMSAISFGETCT